MVVLKKIVRYILKQGTVGVFVQIFDILDGSEGERTSFEALCLIERGTNRFWSFVIASNLGEFVVALTGCRTRDFFSS